MSFEYTNDEKERVELASFVGIKLDPIGHADLAVVVTLSIVYFIDFLAVGYLLWNRKYPPLKSKYPILMSSCILSLFVWFLGDLVLKSHVHLRGRLLTDCMLFCVWMRVLLGNFMVSALISIRSYALFCIFRRNRAYRGKYVYGSVGVVAFVALAFILVTYLLPRSKTVQYIELIQMCTMSYTYRALVQGLLWITWIVNAVINFRLRYITSSFNESREMGVACFCVFILLTFNTVILYTHPLYPTSAVLRVTESLMSHVIANFLWWFIMFNSLYNCAFRRSAYLVEWKDKLVRDGLQKQYQISRTDPFSTTMMSVESSAKMVTLRRDNETYGYDQRMSFSRNSINRQTTQRLWRGDGTDHRASVMSDDNVLVEESNVILFSPQRDGNQISTLENISSATTIHDGSLESRRHSSTHELSSK
ncbi:hypothetical protein GGI25_005767 [Coemansia spiralis]|uniref:Uncharacterized protein n=2 Tax=Coemansia TaxID=4863 RepID=A0A9W8KW52_9FUNG|nr:hypothetical protein BX070DRAFT_224619 [Coemansia spiralis]KAJ1988561.1 hypothetical protein EDC05_005224 [Coemansia umbellata]KAJ2619909.1 hypothetical protein GGI26_005444 [Coemansia sp. RSA 1358]KAJ2670632.1 hypothetical protein GGI25_005767 [Coemansia spiralis]